MVLDVAMAASAREWPDRLHRHVLDYGGARVVGRLMGATQCVDTDFDVIFIDDVCSFLTSRLVTMLRQRGRAVVGVFDPADSPDAKRRLLECGISDVIESDASPEEFRARAEEASVDFRPTAPLDRPTPKSGRAFAVVGVNDGVGCTEVALGLAAAGTKGAVTCLVDLDPVWPSVLQRLDLAPHPNLRTLIDVTLHGGDLGQALQRVGQLAVSGGSPGHGSQSIPVHELSMAIEALTEVCEILVADLGSVERVAGPLLRGFEAVILVGGSDPVSLARMLKARERLVEIVDDPTVLVAINKAPRRPFYRSEIRAELTAAMGSAPFVLLPFEEAMFEAAWDGRTVSRGRFGREVGRVASLMVGAVAR